MAPVPPIPILRRVDSAWVTSLPEYAGATTVRALQIQHIETYGPDGPARDRKGSKKVAHQSLGGLTPSEGKKAGKPLPSARPEPEELGDRAVARLTPVDQSYVPFEVDEAFMRTSKPHTGGYYIIFATGAEGFDAPETFTRQYTLVTEPGKVEAPEADAPKDPKEPKAAKAAKAHAPVSANRAKAVASPKAPKAPRASKKK